MHKNLNFIGLVPISVISVCASTIAQIVVFKQIISSFGPIGGGYYIVLGLTAGIIGGAINNFYIKITKQRTLVWAIDALRIATIAIVAVIGDSTIILFGYLLLLISDAVYNAQRIAVISGRSGDETSRSVLITWLQTAETSATILAPVAAAVLVLNINMINMLIIDAITFSISMIYWFYIEMICRIRVEQKPRTFIGGYKFIIQNKKLASLTAFRTAAASITIVWSIIVPMKAIQAFGANTYTTLQALSTCLTAATMIVMARYATKIYRKNMNFLYKLCQFCVTAISGIMIYGNSNGFTINAIMSGALIIGVTLTAFRLLITIIGQKITAPTDMSVAIFYGDSISRISLVMISLATTYILSEAYFFSIELILCAFTLSMCGTIFLIKLGKEEMRSNELI